MARRRNATTTARGEWRGDPPRAARAHPRRGFADDTGAARPPDGRAGAVRRGPASYGDALLALQDARLLVPVVAVLGEVEVDEHGLAHDKTSDMAAVLLPAADGRPGLLAFTGTESLARVGPRGPPGAGAHPAGRQSAVQDGAAALVVDLAGPTTFVVEGDDLRGSRPAGGWLARVAAARRWIGPVGGMIR